MAGQWIEIKAADGGKFRGYLAVPASGKGPGIVLCQEIFGINPYIREVADYYAEEGYVVLAPDLFWRLEKDVDLGYTETEWKKAFDLLQRFVIYLEFVLLAPLVGIERFGRLQLEINAEFHVLLSLLKAHVSTRAPGRLGADLRHLYVQPDPLSTWG